MTSGRLGTIWPRRRRAFTLVELMVVISIFVLVLAIAVPAFSAMLYSSSQSMAENGLRIGLGAARDAAARSSEGNDAAAVFFFTPGGKISIVPCERVGTLEDVDAMDNPILRDVFVPIPAFEPVQLPHDWMVRGLAPKGTIETTEEWYYSNDANRSADPTFDNWVFPESGFFDTDVADDGPNRQTFMIRFNGATGTLRSSDASTALIFAPSPSTTFRTGQPFADYRADREEDPARFVRRVLASSLSLGDKQALLGDVSSDTVLARAVGQAAIYNEKRMAAALGATLDRVTGTIYVAPPTPQALTPHLGNAGGAPIHPRNISRWIEGHLPGPGGTFVESDARLFAVQRYLGWLQEVTGTEGSP